PPAGGRAPSHRKTGGGSTGFAGRALRWAPLAGLVGQTPAGAGLVTARGGPRATGQAGDDRVDDQRHTSAEDELTHPQQRLELRHLAQSTRGNAQGSQGLGADPLKDGKAAGRPALTGVSQPTRTYARIRRPVEFFAR